MKKIGILLMTTIFLTACNFGNANKVTLIDQEEDEEVVAAMVALNDASQMPVFDLEPDMPSNIDFDGHINEIAGEVDLVYIMKIQFTDEI